MVTAGLVLMLVPFLNSASGLIVMSVGLWSGVSNCLDMSSEFMSLYIIKWGSLLIVLTWVVLLLMNLSAPPSVSLCSLMTSLAGALVLLFLTDSALLFYLWFEMTLLPMALIILAWGYQPERLGAVVYMIFYTLSAAIPFLAVILMSGGISFSLLGSGSTSGGVNTSSLTGWMYLLPFLVKAPMFLLHLWLPKAHVEAPVYGSMVLAGVLLKMGGWGVARLSPIIPLSPSSIGGAISILGGGAAAGITMTQVDIKSLIAYSSVVHMALTTTCLLLPSQMLLGPVWMMLLGHGICSSGLFYLATIIYSRVGSRSLLIAQGAMKLMPGVMLIWVVLLLMNLSAPPSVSLMAEILMAKEALHFSLWGLIPIVVMVVGVLIYSLLLYYSYVLSGINWQSAVAPDSVKESLISAAHAHWWVLSPIILWLFE